MIKQSQTPPFPQKKIRLSPLCFFRGGGGSVHRLPLKRPRSSPGNYVTDLYKAVTSSFVHFFIHLFLLVNPNLQFYFLTQPQIG